MHDAKGRELRVGDLVMVPFVVTNTTSSAEYCNVSLETVATMPPNNSKSSFGAINTRQVLRANEGDDLSFSVVHRGLAVELV